MKPRGLFITGTDTEVGKTHVSVSLLHLLRGLGLTAVGMKPVASGAERRSGQWVNADAQALRDASSFPLPYEQVNPYVFEPPVAPHLAAAQVGVRVDIARIRRRFHELAAKVECVVVEGVGGWRVPLNPEADVADLAAELGLPVLLVVGLRLGCISHARLTHESIMASGVTFGGWIANAVVADLPFSEDIVATLVDALRQEPLGILGFQAADDGASKCLPQQWNSQEILRLVMA